jgi:hypothetical protein
VVLVSQRGLLVELEVVKVVLTPVVGEVAAMVAVADSLSVRNRVIVSGGEEEATDPSGLGIDRSIQRSSGIAMAMAVTASIEAKNLLQENFIFYRL